MKRSKLIGIVFVLILILIAKKTEVCEAKSSDFVIVNGVLIEYNGESSHVVIPDTVTAIDNSVFEEKYFVEKVTIPNTVKSITRDVLN